MEEKLQLFRQLSACLGSIEVQLVSTDGDSFQTFVAQSLYGSLLPVVSKDHIRDVMEGMKPGWLYILGGALDLVYAMLRIDEKRFLCVGPCLSREFSENRIRAGLRPFRLSGASADRVISYCRWQPYLSAEKLHRLGILLGRHVLDLPDPIPHQRIDYRWDHLAPIPEAEPERDQIRRIEQRYEASTALTEAVKQGNLSLAYSFVQGFHPDRSQIHRNPDPLRNAQNICLILNTQLRCALEECHIHPYRLDQVSDGIAQTIEKLKTPESAGQYCAQIIRRYCDLALENRYPGLSRLTHQAVVHIKSHLNDNLTVMDTADVLLVNANYLSGVFHREMGMTFISFVNHQRAEQAAALLRQTNMQIQHIAAAVGYNNTSYFNRQFAAIYGCTPKQYRASGPL